MPLDLSGQRVLVAGASRGIGRAIALQFAAAGAAVSLCARGAEALEAARAEVAACGHPAHAQHCDLADPASIRAWVQAAAEQLGGIDVLVNNASGLGMGDDEAGWAASLNIDIMAMVRSSQAALPHLRVSSQAGRGPSILNLSSISAFRPSLRAPAYAAAKAAMNSYTASQAAMLARDGIRVNAIAPGSIEFPGGLWEQRREQEPELYQRTLRGIPFGRMGRPEEIADVALFLASSSSRWMTGQVLNVDGGQLLGGLSVGKELNPWLLAAAAGDGFAALLHLGCIAFGASWYRAMGAGEGMARLAEAGSARPTLITLAITAVLLVWALYALSGAGAMRELPLMRLALLAISAVLLLRGLGFLFLKPYFPGNSLTFWIVSSGVCLLLGGLHAIGLVQIWSRA